MRVRVFAAGPVAASSGIPITGSATAACSAKAVPAGGPADLAAARTEIGIVVKKPENQPQPAYRPALVTVRSCCH